MNKINSFHNSIPYFKVLLEKMSYSPGQEIPLLWNLEVKYHVQQSVLLYHILREFYQFVPSHHTSLRYILTLSSHLHLGLRSGSYPQGFLTKILYAFVMHAMCPTHFSFLDLIT